MKESPVKKKQGQPFEVLSDNYAPAGQGDTVYLSDRSLAASLVRSGHLQALTDAGNPMSPSKQAAMLDPDQGEVL